MFYRVHVDQCVRVLESREIQGAVMRGQKVTASNDFDLSRRGEGGKSRDRGSEGWKA